MSAPGTPPAMARVATRRSRFPSCRWPRAPLRAVGIIAGSGAATANGARHADQGQHGCGERGPAGAEHPVERAGGHAHHEDRQLFHERHPTGTRCQKSKTGCCPLSYDLLMDLRRLRLFLAVVDEGGFTAAARAVHVAQPAVSLAVRELEEELGAPLLVRSRPASRSRRPATRSCHRLDRPCATSRPPPPRSRRSPGWWPGWLDLASLPTMAADPVADLVGAFRRAHPAVLVRLGCPQRRRRARRRRALRRRGGRCDRGGSGQRRPPRAPVRGAGAARRVSPRGTHRQPPASALSSLEGHPLVLSPTGASLAIGGRHRGSGARLHPHRGGRGHPARRHGPARARRRGHRVPARRPRPIGRGPRRSGSTDPTGDAPYGRHRAPPGPLSPATRAFLAGAGIDPT